jgi:hypothetical protein
VNAFLNGQLANLVEWHEDAIGLVASLDEERLNWRPPVSDANTIAALVRHTIGSLGTWCARVLQEPFERDRDAEFAAHDDAAGLVSALEASRDWIRARVERMDGIDPADERQVRLFGATGDRTVTVGWCLARALRHTGEHWGQIQLTRDLSGIAD